MSCADRDRQAELLWTKATELQATTIYAFIQPYMPLYALCRDNVQLPYSVMTSTVQPALSLN